LRTKDYLVAELEKSADKVSVQEFRYRGMPLWNVIAEYRPEARRKVLLCAHWDTRPRADQELDPAKARKPILGANDGASGVAVLLELGRLFKEKPPSIGVVIVMLDGEDYGDFDRDEGVFLGSRYFARNQRGLKLEYGILLDMVGDKDLVIDREHNSERFAPEVNERVFRIAGELGYGANFVNDLKTNVIDDHIALSQGGIPTIDLIDFNYRHWHTLDDTPDKCSVRSLEIVGSVVAETVYREKDR
jgi:Zn-dependent M28 family amino/carboxypeptidase